MSAQSGAWAWYGAIMVLPKDSSPLWAQLAVHGYADRTKARNAWPLPAGTAPILAWFEVSDVPESIEAFFGANAASQ